MELKVNDLKDLEENINRTCLTLWRRERVPKQDIKSMSLQKMNRIFSKFKVLPL